MNGRPLADYINENDVLTVEKTFAALLVLAEDLDNEQRRAVRDGLTEEAQALFDMLMKSNLKRRYQAIEGLTGQPLRKAARIDRRNARFYGNGANEL